ncbi:MAG TPA: hypothetical protein VFA48_11895 [Gammaproteobacteria bacterium]|nr:hypothetical protein [Gammaproteobacteria bacterium]
MANQAAAGQAAMQGYRSNAVAGLSETQMLSKGLHGLVIHLKRASLAADNEQAGGEGTRAQHLAAADRLLVFLMGIADVKTELGSKLAQCYTAIQQLIGAALGGAGKEPTEALGSALEQARALERALSATVGDDRHGESR